MREIEQWIRMPEIYPAMTPHLVNHLLYDGMADYGNDIILEQAGEIPHLDKYTKIYLHELYTLTRYLPDQAHPISMEE